MGAGRAYEIALHGGEGEPSRLSRSSLRGAPVLRPSQREFAVAPGGRYLAFRQADRGDLVVRSRDGRSWRVKGVHNWDYRFSPDGDAIAYFRRDVGGSATSKLGVLDLKTGGRRALAEFGVPRWLEWTPQGLVALNGTGNTRSLHLVTLAGEKRHLVTGGRISRFTAASRGRHVAYFDEIGAHVIDVTDEAPMPKTIWEPEGYAHVRNAELSPDGRALAFATGRHVHLLRAGQGRTRFAFDDLIHSVWFSEDGERVLFGDAKQAVLVEVESREQRRLSPEAGRIKSLRFRRDGRGAVLAAGDRVLYWTPQSGEQEVAHRVPEGHRLEGADSFGGDLVVWSSRREKPRRMKPPARKKKAATLQKQAVIAP